MAAYTKTVWTTGDSITQTKARNWEDGIEALCAGALALASQAAGDLMYASAASQWVRLAIGAQYSVMQSTGEAPSWVSSITGSVTWNAGAVTTTGPLSVGAAADARFMVGILGTFASTANPRALSVRATLTPTVGTVVNGVEIRPTFVDAGSGTHSEVISLIVGAPVRSGSGATITKATSLQIEGAPSFASTNYALEILSGNTLLGGLITVSGFGTHTVSAGGTGGNKINLQNTTDGAANYSAYDLTDHNGTSSMRLRYNNASFTTSGVNVALGGSLEANYTGGLSIAATHASGAIRFYSGGTTLRWTMDVNGYFVQNGGNGIGMNATGIYQTTWPTTASAANANVTNNDYIKLVSSLRSIKHDIHSIPVDEARRVVLGLDAVLYRSRVDEDQRLWPGLIADDAEQVTRDLATYDQHGNLQSVAYDRVPMYLLPVVQSHDALFHAPTGVLARLETLEKELATLKARWVH